MSAVLARYGEGGGQPQPAALLLGGEKRVEYPVQVLHGYPGTVVHHRDPDVIPCLERESLSQFLCLAQGYIFGPEFYSPTCRHGLLGVDGQVMYDLAYLPRVDLGMPEVRGYKEIAFYIGAAQGKAGGILQQFCLGS